ncbi:histidine phosphatase family protein [Labrys okinawensis]|uniref:Histidine phosphatase family protein n=1 Tax=Labrys okinawensis TaxID=346911 RepID=A0A2S9QED4_9HYPH|nr:histidine phosphatase family protein [Labrys okinawensis]PRH87685.1 histidine phosphatase family protein [Labrys okinawensis]
MGTVRTAYFITHAEVEIDPAIPVPQWRLSAKGRTRHEAFNRQDFVAGIGSVYASDERKARDGGEILATPLGLKLQIVPALHENDRSATGFLPPQEFETTADAFFANPEQSIRGWERAADAQARIVAAVTAILDRDEGEGDIALVAHGGVGALLLCHLLSVPIDRRYDQPAGGGNYFALDVASRRVLHGWKPIDP